MVGAHATAKSETLVDSVVPNEEVILCRLGRMVVVSIVCKPREHIFQIVPREFAFSTV